VSDENAHFVLGEVVCIKCATEIYKQRQATVERGEEIDSDKVGKSTLHVKSADQHRTTLPRYDAIRRYTAKLRRVAEFMADELILFYFLLSVFAAFGIFVTKWYAGIGVFISLGVLVAVLIMICGVVSFLLSLAVDIAEDIHAIRATLERKKD
jgi:hypothetical protein